MSNLGCILPEINLVKSNFDVVKVKGKYSATSVSREINDASEIPINRRFSSLITPIALKTDQSDGLDHIHDIVPSFMSIKNITEQKSFTGRYENVRSKIFEKSNQKIQSKLDSKKATFTNVVDIDDSEFKMYIKTNLACQFGESEGFKAAMLFIVVLNTICLALQTDDELSQSKVIELLDTIFQGIFIFEVFFKWFYGFKVYWKSAWNWLDFGLAAIPLIGSSLAFLNTGKTIKIIRVFKVLRSLRGIQSFESLLRITQSIGRSIPEIINILLLLIILLVVFAIVGVDVLDTDDFYSFENAMFSLFQVTTQDGWVTLVQKCKDAGQSTEAYLFFTFFVIIAVFVLQNLIIAAIVNNTQDTFDSIKKRKVQQLKRLVTLNQNKDPAFYDQQVPITKPKEIDFAKIPFHVLNKSDVDNEKLDKLCLLIGILEKLYCDIEDKSSQLKQIYDSIKTNEMSESNSRNADDYSDLDENDILTTLLKSK